MMNQKIDSKYLSRKSQAVATKGKDKEANDIGTLTRLVNNLTIEVSELKQQKTETSVSNYLPRQRQGSSSSSSNRFTLKIA